MHLIDEIEISYFRSFYKARLRGMRDLNVIFGKNDIGKSNIVRALNLFFSGRPEHANQFDFPIDFSDRRAAEAETSDDVRKFLYVKITFKTPPSFQKSLGTTFSVKRQWTVSRGTSFHEEFSSNIASNRRHIAVRFMNRIKFMYIPAIKDARIFEMLLSDIHETISSSTEFSAAVGSFSTEIQNITSELFSSLPKDVSTGTKIGAPNQLSQLFQTLDFETTPEGGNSAKSLTRQRGDGIKARHIPELLNFISQKDKYDYHIWGFEEPENSLDFAAAQAEAQRFLTLAQQRDTQIFMTTHSPSFYLINSPSIAKYYVQRDELGGSEIVQGRALDKIDVEHALNDGFYLPAVAAALKGLAEKEEKIRDIESRNSQLSQQLKQIGTPVVLTEGRTDARILLQAWQKRRGGEPPFRIQSCETGVEAAGSGNGGAQMLAVRLKGIAADNPNAVIGIFDYDEEGINAYKLDKNFVETQYDGFSFKRGMHGKSYGTPLIAPDFRAECFKYKNLPIEYIFDDETLNSSSGETGIRLRRKRMSMSLGGEKIEHELADETHFKDVVGGKANFVSNFVTSMEAECFRGFDKIFEMIEAIIRYDEGRV